MITPAESTSRVAGKRKGPAVLFLDGKAVGMVHAQGGDTSWGFGKFIPNDSFSAYAPLFGTWSVLMHAEDEIDRLSREAREELAKAEEMLDSLKARLFFASNNEHVRVAQLTIDGDRLEWKEY